jgi:hypothetical protein
LGFRAKFGFGDLELRVWGLWGLGRGVWCLVFGIWGLGLGIWCLGFRVSDRGLAGPQIESELRPEREVVLDSLTVRRLCSGFNVQGSGFRVQGAGFRV